MVQELFEKYKAPFLEWLEDMCNEYKAIGSGTDESPMWLQYCGIHDHGDEENRPKFRSSQRNLGFFLNYIDEEDKIRFRQVQYGDLYNLFRNLKYEYIKENHPTVYSELS